MSFTSLWRKRRLSGRGSQRDRGKQPGRHLEKGHGSESQRGHPFAVSHLLSNFLLFLFAKLCFFCMFHAVAWTDRRYVQRSLLLSVTELNQTLNQMQDCKIHTFRITQGNRERLTCLLIRMGVVVGWVGGAVVKMCLCACVWPRWDYLVHMSAETLTSSWHY